MGKTSDIDGESNDGGRVPGQMGKRDPCVSAGCEEDAQNTCNRKKCEAYYRDAFFKIFVFYHPYQPPSNENRHKDSVFIPGSLDDMHKSGRSILAKSKECRLQLKMV